MELCKLAGNQIWNDEVVDAVEGQGTGTARMSREPRRDVGLAQHNPLFPLPGIEFSPHLGQHDVRFGPYLVLGANRVQTNTGLNAADGGRPAPYVSL